MSQVRDIEDLLAHFREWFALARDEAASPATGLDEAPREVGLIDLIEEFTALRHELKLQTKSGRGLQEQSETLIRSLERAVQEVQTWGGKQGQDGWTVGRPLAEGLATVHESLERGRSEIEKARHQIMEEARRLTEADLDAYFGRQGWLRRRLLLPARGELLSAVQGRGEDLRRRWFESLLEGFELIQGRLRRVMREVGVEPIACLGTPVDPERMNVLEVVEDDSLPPHTVVAELRRGYLWHGRVVRYAEVRATRGYGPGRRDEHEAARAETHEADDGMATDLPIDGINPETAPDAPDGEA